MTRIIGFDLGTKTLGIAISDCLGITTRGLETFRFDEGNYDLAIDRALEVINRENVNEVVIGFPLNMDGSKSAWSLTVMDFKKKMEEKNPSLKIVMIDERLTTVAANKNLIAMNIPNKRKKQIIDMEAASIILQTYLDQISISKKNH